MQPASKQDGWAQGSLFSDTGLLVSVPAGAYLLTGEAWSEHGRLDRAVRVAGQPAREGAGHAPHLGQGTPVAPSPLGRSWAVRAARTAKQAELSFHSHESPPRSAHLSIVSIFIFTSCFCNGFTTGLGCAWQRRGAFTAIPESPRMSWTCACCRHMKGTSSDPTDPVLYLSQCQCSRFTRCGLVWSHARRGGPVEGWPLVCLNQPAGAWGHRNLLGEGDKRGRLEQSP